MTDLGRYLGVPILPDGRRSNLYADIVSRVQTKLAGWKANCLSLAGTAFSLWIESGFYRKVFLVILWFIPIEVSLNEMKSMKNEVK